MSPFVPCHTFFSSSSFRGAKIISHAASPLVKKNAWRDGSGGGGGRDFFALFFLLSESENARYDGKCKKSKRKRNGGSIQTLIREAGAREGGRGENNLGSDRYPYLTRDTPTV